ncbi:MAG: BlaI/MecI/CopY family transcriptional regulator [Muribaculaceae bacterium]|nr:BlaI/MecI/CopY family transcriptional regulator [Muribaculaceae bacterium]
MKKLTDKEEELMQHFWQHGPMFVKQIVELYPEPRPHFNTVSTFVRGLEQKSYVTHEQYGNTYLYRAAISRDEYSRMTLKSVISRYFNNSLFGVVSALFKEEKLSDEEIRELVDKVVNDKGSNE